MRGERSPHPLPEYRARESEINTGSESDTNWDPHMKDAFELNTNSTAGPSPRGSLHAQVSLELNQSSGFVPDPPAVIDPTPAVAKPVELPPLSQPLKPKPLVSFVVSTHN